MEYIVHGSKNQNYSKFKVTLKRVCIWVKSQTCMTKICWNRSKRRIVSTNSLQSKFKFTIKNITFTDLINICGGAVAESLYLYFAINRDSFYFN